MICERRDVKGVNTDRDTKNKYGEEIFHALHACKKEKKILIVCNIIVDTHLSIIRNIS